MNNLVYGVGVNDANYNVTARVNGKLKLCDFYRTWKSMLQRCYDQKYLSWRATYRGCSVVEEWHLFSTFKEWMEKQDWKGKQLDKDLLVLGNNIYGPESCMFVSSKINNLLLDCRAARGECSVGVYKSDGKYRAMVSRNSKRIHLGYYDTDREAYDAWRKAKSEIINEIAEDQIDLRLRVVLRTIAIELLQRGLNNGAI